MKELIIIILIIVIIIISFNNIIYENFINSTPIICGSSDTNLDTTCNVYNTKKALLSDIQNNYNLAIKNTIDKYDLWDFSKREVLLKKAALDQAIIVDTNLKDKNNTELISKILLCIIYAKTLVIIENYQYPQTSIEYINAINMFNSSVIDAKLLQINNSDGYKTPSEAFAAAMTAYNNNISSIPNNGHLISSISIETSKQILENTLNAAKDLLITLNDNYLIPSLSEYNNRATIANLTVYDINSDLSSLKSNAQTQYNLANTNKETNIASALANYKSAIRNQIDKLQLFYNLISELKIAFSIYINYLINPENGYLNNKIPSGTNKCDTYTNLASLSSRSYSSQLTLTISKNNARDTSTRQQTRSIVDNNITGIDSKYSNLIKSINNKINILTSINANNENNYNKNDLMNSSKNINDIYLEYVKGNDDILKTINDYNNTTEKQNYNAVSLQYIINNINYLNALADIKKCYPNSDRPTIKTV
jgi:hypothetical protein